METSWGSVGRVCFFWFGLPGFFCWLDCVSLYVKVFYLKFCVCFFYTLLVRVIVFGFCCLMLFFCVFCFVVVQFVFCLWFCFFILFCCCLCCCVDLGYDLGFFGMSDVCVRFYMDVYGL